MSASIVQLEPRTGGLRRRVVGIYALLALFNVGAWLWAFANQAIGFGLLRYPHIASTIEWA